MTGFVRYTCECGAKIATRIQEDVHRSTEIVTKVYGSSSLHEIRKMDNIEDVMRDTNG